MRRIHNNTIYQQFAKCPRAKNISIQNNSIFTPDDNNPGNIRPTYAGVCEAKTKKCNLNKTKHAQMNRICARRSCGAHKYSKYTYFKYFVSVLRSMIRFVVVSVVKFFLVFYQLWHFCIFARIACRWNHTQMKSINSYKVFDLHNEFNGETKKKNTNIHRNNNGVEL